MIHDLNVATLEEGNRTRSGKEPTARPRRPLYANVFGTLSQVWLFPERPGKPEIAEFFVVEHASDGEGQTRRVVLTAESREGLDAPSRDHIGRICALATPGRQLAFYRLMRLEEGPNPSFLITADTGVGIFA